MKFLIFLLCAVSLTQAATFSTTIGDCGCDCECPDPTQPPCPTPCEPASVCDNLVNAASSFSTNCAASIEDLMVAQMYADCLAFDGTAAFEDFKAQIQAICAAKKGDFEWEEVVCPTEIPPTTCAPVSVCENLVDATSDFSVNCAPSLEALMIAQMYDDCLAFDGTAAFEDFKAQIQAVCAFKSGAFVWEEVECPTVPPTPEPTFDVTLDCTCSCTCPLEPCVVPTTCVPLLPCSALEGLCPSLSGMIRDQVVADCEACADDICIQSLFDNLENVCTDKGEPVVLEIPEGC